MCRYRLSFTKAVMAFLEYNLTVNDEQFNEFRGKHTVSHRTISGRNWSYIVAGSGSRAVVILPGAGAFEELGAEVMFQVVSALEKHARVISIGYPPGAQTVRAILEGIKTVLDSMGIPTAVLVGHSLGGLFSACFVQAFPEMVDSVVIANFAIPSKRRSRRFRILLPALIHLPNRLIVSACKWQMRGFLKGHQAGFWISKLQSRETNRTLRHMSSHYRCMLDFLENWHISRKSVTNWNGRALIMESSDEQLFSSEEREALRRLFRNTTVRVIQKAGHLSWITRPQEFEEAITEFL